jgi:hypothetical protein
MISVSTVVDDPKYLGAAVHENFDDHPLILHAGGG